MTIQMNNPIATLSQRIESIDVLRGLTIFTMIFANDLYHVKGVPAWLGHMPTYTNGMTFVDLVFPAFLFLVGMSIPFAINKRLEKGDTLFQLWKHILIRSLSLICIGLFMVNGHFMSNDGVLPPYIWKLLLSLGVIFIWAELPKEPTTKRKIMQWLRYAGFILLLALAFLYRGPGDPGFFEMRTWWWGILAWIGWAYLVACIIYVPMRNNIGGLVGAMGILYCFYMAAEVGFFKNILPWEKMGTLLGSHSAIVIAGIIPGIMLSPESAYKKHSERIRWAILYGLFLAIAGLLLNSMHDIHNVFIISKRLGTPPWCLLSSAFTVWIWAFLYWILDVHGWTKWAVFLRSAGTNALFAFIAVPICYSLLDLLATLVGYNFYAELGNTFAIGFCRSLALAFVVVWLVGRLRRLGIWLKL